MSVVSSFEPKNFGLASDCAYPSTMDAGVHAGSDGDPADHVRYSPQPDHGLQGLDAAFSLSDEHDNILPTSPMALPTPPANSPSPSRTDHSGTSTAPRLKPVPKPDREISKNVEGKYVCTWPDCQERIKEFSRKCEWSKHMDKHDRPYKCLAPGCEKQPGFTYSGGLLRHEREVHNKHGGPKKPLNCPIHYCKRSKGKGFSRQENLNEHMRRCHTDAGPVSGRAGSIDGSDDGGINVVGNLVTPTENGPTAIVGEKRKRDDDLRDEVKRLRQENVELRSALDQQRLSAEARDEAQKRQSVAMMEQLEYLRRQIDGMPAAQSNDTPDLLEDIPQ